MKEVWSVTTKQHQQDVMASLLRQGVPYPTAYAWFTGARRPKPLYQKLVVDTLKRVTGDTYLAETLFPEISDE